MRFSYRGDDLVEMPVSATVTDGVLDPGAESCTITVRAGAHSDHWALSVSAAPPREQEPATPVAPRSCHGPVPAPRARCCRQPY
ncbi:hypothetical protein BN381_350069 [Candidatus Microthrix parvicella RN1]|uniref:Uncharacterized protein n=1 Tax=Candidatus Neomicrothrix parvicella RN1 TaxID=1229780 RepID=R4YZY4_9ACTN|nr:hypothetical protein BN381_350069 [Candidatus Microthrix parvicella RN1]